MPERERPIDITPEENEHPSKIDERVFEGDAEDNLDKDPAHKIDEIPGAPEEEKEEGA